MVKFDNIKVGDVVRLVGPHSELIAKVVKVNKTTFVAGKHIFKKVNGAEYGGDAWYKWWAYPPTQNDIVRITTNAKKSNLIRNIMNATTYDNLMKYDIEVLQKVSELLGGE